MSGRRGTVNVAVVGGGITGCATALSLADAGCSVSLYELGPSLGGSLKDVRDESGFWFSACQYLSPTAAWLQELRSQTALDLIEFEHRYASYTVAGDDLRVRSDMALPVLPAPVPPVPTSARPPETMSDRFDQYGPQIGKLLEQTARRAGHEPSTLASNCAIAMQLGAVMIDAPLAEVLALKSRDPLADQLFAVPRQLRSPTAPKLMAALPRGGYDPMFEAIGAHLASRGVKVQCKAPVMARPVHGSDVEFAALLDGERIDCDLTVWCCNPTGLMIAAGLGRIDSPAVKYTHCHGILTGGRLDDALYIQVHDPKTSVYRIYLYPAGGVMKVCLERMPQPQESQDAAVNYTNAVLQSFVPGARFEVRHEMRYTAHFLYTLRDRGIFDAFQKRARKSRFVSGAWSEFGRDPKIAVIRKDAFAALSEAGSVVQA